MPSKSGISTPLVEKKTQKPVITVNETEIPSYGTAKKIPVSPITAKTETPSQHNPTKAVADDGLTLNDVEKAWPQVIEHVKAKRMSTSLFLAEAEPAEVEGSMIILGLPSEFRFHKETLEKDSNKQLIEEAFTHALGRKVRVQCVVTEREGATQEASGEIVPAKDEGVSDIVSKALEIFDGSKVIRKD